MIAVSCRAEKEEGGGTLLPWRSEILHPGRQARSRPEVTYEEGVCDMGKEGGEDTKGNRTCEKHTRYPDRS